MEQLAAPGTTRLTAETLRAAEGFIEVAGIGPVPVKGLSQPVEVYELSGAGAARTRLHAAVMRGLTRFVGRRNELDVMARAIEHAAGGHGEIVALVGEPGVGKSRLVWEFTRSHRVHGWLVLEAGSVSYGKATAYRPVIDLLQAYFLVEDRDDARRIRERTIGKLLTLDRQLEPLLVPLLSLLDVAVEDVQWAALDPAQKRLRTLEACKRLLLREAQVQPVVLVFEDLHWIDNETQAFLDSLTESLPTARLVLLVNYRPEYRHRWSAKSYYTQLRIDPLPGETAGELLASLLGSDASLLPLKRLLIERTEGNPLFLEESVRTLAESGELQGSRGAYRLASSAHNIHVPATVQAILAARIDRLAPENKRLLQAGAVIGKDVPFALLQAIAELPDERLREDLADLQAGEFLYEASVFPDLEYTFKHALTHEVTYGSLLQDRRRVLHARIMEAIERCYADRLVEHMERLAHHAFRGEIWAKATSYLRQAGERAYSRSALREAAAAVAQALVALTHQPETRETLEQAIDLRLLVRTPLVALGEMTRLREYAREADELVKKLDDPQRQGWVSSMNCHACVMLAKLTESDHYGHRALAIATELGDVKLRAATTYYLGIAHMLRGSHREATEFLLRNSEAPTASIRDFQSVNASGPMFAFRLAGAAGYTWSRAYAAYSFAELGAFEDSIACGEESQRAAAVLDLTLSRGGADWSLGFAHLRMGSLERARPLLERCLQTARTADLPVLFVMVASHLGGAYNLLGRFQESIGLLEEAREMIDSTSNMAFAPPIHAHLGEAYGLSGRIEAAVAALQHALELARRHEERGYEAWTLYLTGKVHALREHPDFKPAYDAYGQALALAGELEMHPLKAQCHLGVGQLARGAGKSRDALEHCRIAVTMFRDMRMQSWLEKAESALIP